MRILQDGRRFTVVNASVDPRLFAAVICRCWHLIKTLSAELLVFLKVEPVVRSERRVVLEVDDVLIVVIGLLSGCFMQHCGDLLTVVIPELIP